MKLLWNFLFGISIGGDTMKFSTHKHATFGPGLAHIQRVQHFTSTYTAL